MFQYIAQGGFSCWLIFIKWMYIICANLQGERKPGKREVLILLIFTSPITFPQLAHLNWLHIQSRSLLSCNLVIMRKTPVGGHFIETLRFLGPRGFSMQVLILVFSINLVSNFSYLFYFPLKKKNKKNRLQGVGCYVFIGIQCLEQALYVTVCPFNSALSQAQFPSSQGCFLVP